MRSILTLLLLVGLRAGAQGPVTPPPMPVEQERRVATMPSNVQMYEQFRYWAGFQPQDIRADALRHYEEYLASRGVSAAERAKHIKTIESEGRLLEVERWNRILTSEAPTFNTNPNAFLVEMTRDRPPGTALDVGMGQGRNAIYLAQQRWAVTGFDPADKAVAQAQATAAQLGLKLTTYVQGDDDFDFGTERWDLIVMTYVAVRPLVERVVRGLKPGGIVVVEGFHRDVTRNSSVGGAVVFDTNELPQLFSKLRVLRYEDVIAKTDFGGDASRAVRLCAQKEIVGQ